MRKLQMAEFAISNFYVDKVDEDKLVEEAIIKMLAQLDPHSTYSDASPYLDAFTTCSHKSQHCLGKFGCLLLHDFHFCLSG